MNCPVCNKPLVEFEERTTGWRLVLKQVVIDALGDDEQTEYDTSKICCTADCAYKTLCVE